MKRLALVCAAFFALPPLVAALPLPIPAHAAADVARCTCAAADPSVSRDEVRALQDIARNLEKLTDAVKELKR